MYIHLSDHTFLLLTLVTAACFKLCLAQTCDYRSRPHPRGHCGANLALLRSNVCEYLYHAYPQYFPDRARRSLDTSSSISSSRGPKSRRSERSAESRREISRARLQLLAERIGRHIGTELEEFLDELEWALADRYDVGDLPSPDAFEDLEMLSMELSEPSWTDDLPRGNFWLERLLNMTSPAHQFHANDYQVKRDPKPALTSNRKQFGSDLTLQGSNTHKRSDEDEMGVRLSRGKRNLVCECCYNACNITTVALYC